MLIVYVKTQKYQEQRELTETSIRGRLAMYGLMLEQRKFNNLDLCYPKAEIEKALQDLQYHQESPDSTYFYGRLKEDDAGEYVWILDSGSLSFSELAQEFL